MGDNVHTFESNDFGGRVHDGRVCSDGTADGVGWVRQVDNDHLGSVPNLLPHADKLVRLHGERGEPNLLHVNANVLELWGEE